MKRGIAVQVRLLREDEMPALEREAALGPVQKHRDRLVLQATEEAVYLVAWEEDRPVGHVLVAWNGTPDEPMACSLRDCPDIEDLFVSPDYRRRGIASELMAAAEKLVRQREYRRVGLGVAVGNQEARALYGRRSYLDAGFGEYRHDSCISTSGHYEQRTEICTYLIKDLQ